MRADVEYLMKLGIATLSDALVVVQPQVTPIWKVPQLPGTALQNVSQEIQHMGSHIIRTVVVRALQVKSGMRVQSMA